MCGIVGTVGPNPASEILYEGLKRLEYRGYDSAGLAVLDGHEIGLRRAEGKLARLGEVLKAAPLAGSLGIGHTRWATHGKPSERNAHPHLVDRVALVHNGIIENHQALRVELAREGAVFASETDSEILSHLIARGIRGGLDLEGAVRQALARVAGSYAVAAISADEPDTLIVARAFSPLVVGLSDEAAFVASDLPAILPHTRDVLFLEDGELAVLRPGRMALSSLAGEAHSRPLTHIDWSPAMAEKGGYKHFMLKEIMEEPRALSDTLRGRLSLLHGAVEFEEAALDAALRDDISRVVIVACGTSWHAGLLGKHLIERLAKLPVEVDVASEFRTRDPLLDSKSLLIAISQSGETADTLAALAHAKGRGAKTLAICNVLESSLARSADHKIYTHAGPEISVASTKAFTTQIAVLYLLAVALGRVRGTLGEDEAAHRLLDLARLPALMTEFLREAESLRALARSLHGFKHFLFVGRALQVPIALEGALKLKEISYIHAEGYPAGEMKHGPIALIDEGVAVIALAPRNPQRAKMLGSLAEARARGAYVVAVGTRGDEELAKEADLVIPLPAVDETLEPFLTILPLQVLAYTIADFNGTDVDQPRNLAKSVTVE